MHGVPYVIIPGKLVVRFTAILTYLSVLPFHIIIVSMVDLFLVETLENLVYRLDVVYQRYGRNFIRVLQHVSF